MSRASEMESFQLRCMPSGKEENMTRREIESLQNQKGVYNKTKYTSKKANKTKKTTHIFQPTEGRGSREAESGRTPRPELPDPQPNKNGGSSQGKARGRSSGSASPPRTPPHTARARSARSARPASRGATAFTSCGTRRSARKKYKKKRPGLRALLRQRLKQVLHPILRRDVVKEPGIIRSNAKIETQEWNKEMKAALL